jgi:hypothetical protein
MLALKGLCPVGVSEGASEKGKTKGGLPLSKAPWSSPAKKGDPCTLCLPVLWLPLTEDTHRKPALPCPPPSAGQDQGFRAGCP